MSGRADAPPSEYWAAYRRDFAAYPNAAQLVPSGSSNTRQVCLSESDVNHQADDAGTIDELRKQVQGLLDKGDLQGTLDKMRAFTVNGDGDKTLILTHFQQAKLIIHLRHFMQCGPCRTTSCTNANCTHPHHSCNGPSVMSSNGFRCPACCMSNRKCDVGDAWFRPRDIQAYSDAIFIAGLNLDGADLKVFGSKTNQLGGPLDRKKDYSNEFVSRLKTIWGMQSSQNATRRPEPAFEIYEVRGYHLAIPTRVRRNTENSRLLNPFEDSIDYLTVALFQARREYGILPSDLLLVIMDKFGESLYDALIRPDLPHDLGVLVAIDTHAKQFTRALYNARCHHWIPPSEQLLNSIETIGRAMYTTLNRNGSFDDVHEVAQEAADNRQDDDEVDDLYA